VPGQRGKGIGASLIQSILDVFLKKGCIISETEVFVENLPAVKAYEKAGFKKRLYKMQVKLDDKGFRPFC
jgi:GNAT superfamily N-acetyltransferase